MMIGMAYPDISEPMQGLALQPKNLTISSGCGAIINNLIYCITEPGEGVALPAPYYPAFDYDIRVSGLFIHRHASPLALMTSSDHTFTQCSLEVEVACVACSLTA